VRTGISRSASHLEACLIFVVMFLAPPQCSAQYPENFNFDSILLIEAHPEINLTFSCCSMQRFVN